MRIFILSLIIGLTALVMAFDSKKCDHVYVQVEQPVIKVEKGSNFISGVYFAPPSGKHEGPELVCVKCFHTTRQVVDYGEATKITGVLTSPDFFSPLFLSDTVNSTRSSGRTLFLKVDTIQWSK